MLDGGIAARDKDALMVVVPAHAVRGRAVITLYAQHDSAPVLLTEPMVTDDDPVSHSHMHCTTSFVPGGSGSPP